PVGDGVTGGGRDVEAAEPLPRYPVGGGEELGPVVLPLGEHEVPAAVLDHHHVLDPVVADERVPGVAGPGHPVGGGREPEHPPPLWRPIVARVPELVTAVLADDPPA